MKTMSLPIRLSVSHRPMQVSLVLRLPTKKSHRSHSAQVSHRPKLAALASHHPIRQRRHTGLACAMRHSMPVFCHRSQLRTGLAFASSYSTPVSSQDGGGLVSESPVRRQSKRVSERYYRDSLYVRRPGMDSVSCLPHEMRPIEPADRGDLEFLWGFVACRPSRENHPD